MLTEAHLRALNAPAELVVTAERSVVEERGDAQLCSDVALAYDANVTLVDDGGSVNDNHAGKAIALLFSEESTTTTEGQREPR